MKARLTISTVVILAFGIALTGCESTPTGFSKWETISEKESLVSLTMPEEQKSRVIARKSRRNLYQVQELWSWRGGKMFIAHLFPGYYIRRTYDKPDELKDTAKDWNRLKRMGLVIEDKDIKFAVGGAGRLIYSVSLSPNGDYLCFVFLQAIGDRDGGDSPGGTEASGGFGMGYHCVRGGLSQKAYVVDTMLKVLESVKFQQ